MRTIPLVIYVALMVWVMLPEDDWKVARMYGIKRAIRYHRAQAEFHGRKVIALENAYKEACEA